MLGPRTSNAVDRHVGSRLRLRRKELKISQTVLGDRLGITFQQIQKYELGSNRIGASRLWNTAQALGVPVGYFFTGLEGSGKAFDDRETNAVTKLIRSPDGYNFAAALEAIPQGNLRRQILEFLRSVSRAEKS